MIPATLKDRIAELPNEPGCYFFKDRAGVPVYIGKAVSIKKRVQSHFRYFGETFSKEGVMLSEVRRIDFVRTPGEAEALLLEASLVKQHMPKYNAMLKDDKSYPFLKLTNEEYPRLIIARGRKSDGSTYFGPFTELGLLKKAVKMLRATFPLRTCRKLPKKVCLMYHLGLCHGPCEIEDARTEYPSIVKELKGFLEGRKDVMVRALARQMREYSTAEEFEKAQACYEQMRALSSLPVPPKPKAIKDRALADLRDAFGLPSLPKRIECYDISNIQGSEPVGSMVVFENGEPARSQYRRFRVKTVKGIDDFKMMREVIGRRFRHAGEAHWPTPDLVIVDGGKGQLSSALAGLGDAGANVPLISIAKEHEHLFSPESPNPKVFALDSPLLSLVRRLRDEAHRFAITYHRRLHRKAAFQ